MIYQTPPRTKERGGRERERKHGDLLHPFGLIERGKRVEKELRGKETVMSLSGDGGGGERGWERNRKEEETWAWSRKEPGNQSKNELQAGEPSRQWLRVSVLLSARFPANW